MGEEGRPGPADPRQTYARVVQPGVEREVGGLPEVIVERFSGGGVEGAAGSYEGMVRKLNEDAFGTPGEMNVPKELLIEKGRLYAVADGMGGHAAGEVASEQTIEILYEKYYGAAAETVQKRLEEAIEAANIAVRRATIKRYGPEALGEGSKEKMGTTLVAAVLLGDDLYIANIGDSRGYLVCGQSIEQITRDHSWVNEQVEAGNITKQEAREHLYRNIITRSLGSKPDVDIDFFHRKVQEGDVLVLCCDGLTNEVEDGEIARIVSENDPKGATKKLIDLANSRGGPDNITAIVAKVEEIREQLSEAEILRRLAGYVGEEERTKENEEEFKELFLVIKKLWMAAKGGISEKNRGLLERLKVFMEEKEIS